MARKPRKITFVCSAVKEELLISKMIDSESVSDSCNSFEKEFGIKPQAVYGPFYKKKTGILNENFDIKFKFGQYIQCIHNGWDATGMPLLNPPDSVYLLYNKRVDGQKMIKPNPMIVKIKELQDLK